jgi:hypothetical protein
MSNLLQDAAAWLGDRLKESAGRQVIYARGVQESDPITGTVAKHEYEAVENDGSVTLVLAYDWSFTAAELVIAGSPIKPRAGDRISETLNGEPIAFEVLPIGKLPCSEWLDTSGVLLLVHTKKVS